MQSLRNVLIDHLADADTSWSVGCFGAIAEFHWVEDETSGPVMPLGRATARGSIRIDPTALGQDPLGLAWEAPGGRGTGWTQRFVVHVPADEARMGSRNSLTRLGEDEDGTLFDIGIGAAHVDVCVASEDEELIALLDRCSGASIWDETNPAMAAIKEASPTRVFRSRAAELRVHQRIGSRTGLPTPSGPHTHVIRKLLQKVRAHDARIPVPDGRGVILSMYPPHPLRTPMGQRTTFQRAQWDRFQELLEGFGPPEYSAAKKELVAMAWSHRPAAAPAEHSLGRVLLPQLAHLGVTTARLTELATSWGLEHVLPGILGEADGQEASSSEDPQATP